MEPSCCFRLKPSKKFSLLILLLYSGLIFLAIASHWPWWVKSFLMIVAFIQGIHLQLLYALLLHPKSIERLEWTFGSNYVEYINCGGERGLMRRLSRGLIFPEWSLLRFEDFSQRKRTRILFIFADMMDPYDYHRLMYALKLG